MTSDCHLAQFWKKNLGHLTLVPLYKFDDKNIRKKIRENIHENTIPQFKITSLVNPQKIESITVFPAVIRREITQEDLESGAEIVKEEYTDYILSTKEVFSIRVPKPRAVKSGTPLMTTHLRRYDGDGRIRITEPFLSPLTQYVLSQVAGYGTPDYSIELQEILVNNVKAIKNDEI